MSADYRIGKAWKPKAQARYSMISAAGAVCGFKMYGEIMQRREGTNDQFLKDLQCLSTGQSDNHK